MPTGTPGALARMASTRGAVGPHEHLVHVVARVPVALAGREGAAEVADGGHHARLVDRARPLHQAVEPGGRLLAVGGEALGHVVALPAALVGEPERRGEVVERDDRRDARLAQPLAHAGVVVERHGGELAVGRLDAAPLEAEAVVGEARAPAAARRPRASGASCRSSRRSTPCSRSPGLCSHRHQSLLTLPPSIWWAAVAVPQRNPSGKVWSAMGRDRISVAGTRG